HFTASACIECDACIDICPMSCLTIVHDAPDAELRQRLTAPANNLDQPLFVSEPLQHTARVMVKDEDVCIHCGLCAERCPTAAWDIVRSEILLPYAGQQVPAGVEVALCRPRCRTVRTASRSRSQPSTGPARQARTRCCARRSSEWGSPSPARTCSRRTSRGCRRGTRSG